MMGPADDGSYRKVKVKTVHRNRLPCRLIQAGQAACVALQDIGREAVRKVTLRFDWPKVVRLAPNGTKPVLSMYCEL